MRNFIDSSSVNWKGIWGGNGSANMLAYYQKKFKGAMSSPHFNIVTHKRTLDHFLMIMARLYLEPRWINSFELVDMETLLGCLLDYLYEGKIVPNQVFYSAFKTNDYCAQI
jgi:hypothetical protein